MDALEGKEFRGVASIFLKGVRIKRLKGKAWVLPLDHACLNENDAYTKYALRQYKGAVCASN